MSHQKEEREILAQLRGQGWRTERTASGHHKCYPPGGKKDHVLFALGAGGSGFKNAVARLKRSGFVLGQYEPVQVGAQEAWNDSYLDAEGIIANSFGDAAPVNALPSLILSAARRSCEVCGNIELVKGECCKAPEGATFGEALRFLRTEEEIRQEDLADIVETTQERISGFERNATLPTEGEAASLLELFPRLKLAPVPAIVEGAADEQEEVEMEELYARESEADVEAASIDVDEDWHPDSEEAAKALASAVAVPLSASSVAVADEPAASTATSDPIEELWALLSLVGDRIVSIHVRQFRASENGKVRWHVAVERLDPETPRVGDGATVRNACMSIARAVTSEAEAAQRDAEQKAQAAAEAAARLRAITQRIAS